MTFILWIHVVKRIYYLLFEEFCYAFLHWRKSCTIGLRYVHLGLTDQIRDNLLYLMTFLLLPTKSFLGYTFFFLSIFYTTWSSKLLPFWIIHWEDGRGAKYLYLFHACVLGCFSHVQLFAIPGSSVHRDSPGKNTGVGGHALLQGIFLTQGSNPSPTSPALAGRFFTTSATWEALVTFT